MTHNPLTLWNYFFPYFGSLVIIALLLIIVVPLVYGTVIARCWRSTRARAMATVALCGLCGLIVYGDVLVIAINAQRLCHQETGTKVFKVVETDGFLGGAGIVDWSSYGFKYIEYQVGTYYRQTMVAGKEVEERIAAPTSRYEFARESKVAAFGVGRDTWLVRDRTSMEILGKKSSFAIFPGWADGAFFGVTGLTFTPPRCRSPSVDPRIGSPGDINDFIKKILKPIHVK